MSRDQLQLQHLTQQLQGLDQSLLDRPLQHPPEDDEHVIDEVQEQGKIGEREVEALAVGRTHEETADRIPPETTDLPQEGVNGGKGQAVLGEEAQEQEASLAEGIRKRRNEMRVRVWATARDHQR
mmetsp:Transcript_49865/g.73255  ORF Transcript_49865/g.73255 Transcript_49865/m.73255 type:complete len:125 (+) Transcript_49865:3608-3982(+)